MRLIRAAAVLGGLFSVAMVLIVGDHSSLLMIGLALIFCAWAAAPFWFAYARAPHVASSQSASILLLVATIAAVALSVFAYWMTFIDNPKPDAQDGLVLLFVPLYQIGGLGIVVMLANWLSKILK